jgi:hypothetical protein
MLTKVFVLIQRGITDRAVRCVWPWEQPILEEIHGGSAQPITIDELCELKGAASVKKVKMLHKKAEDGLTMREQYEAMAKMDPERNPLSDPEQEWGRLIECYGMHVNVKLPNAEKVYGSFGNFRQAMKEYLIGRTPGFLEVSGPIETEAEDEVVEAVEDKPRRRRAA